MQRRQLIALALAASFSLSACGPQPSQSAPPVRVFAAASLTDALTEVAAAFAQQGEAAPVLNFAASSTLGRQIEQGADADIFISADETWMDYLAEKTLIVPASRASLLSNTLVLIAPTDHPITLSIAPNFALAEALDGGRLAIADPDSVPAGRYGRAALQSLGVWERVSPSVVRAEDVRAALRLVETGEAAAGVVYGSDANAAGARVQLVDAFPAGSHPPISYPVAIVAEHERPGVTAFLNFLRTEEAQAIFGRHGFTPIDIAPTPSD